jgi:hypothetical protein
MYQRRPSSRTPILDTVPIRWWGARCAVVLALLMITACIRPVAPGPVVIRITPPPWDAPRDAISYIEAAGLTAEPLNTTGETHIVGMTIVVDGWRVSIPAYVGVDRLRAQQAAVHTHDTTNQVWLEGRDIDPITLGQFFTVWAVRFDGRCLGAACREVTVTADGKLVTDPVLLRLAQVRQVTVTAWS